MLESSGPGEQYKNWKAPTTSREQAEASGEIGADKLPSLEEVIAKQVVAIQQSIQERTNGREIPTAAASSLKDSLRAQLRDVRLGGQAIKDIGSKKLGDYFQTGQEFRIPTNLGELRLALVVRYDEGLRRPVMELEDKDARRN